MAAVSREGVTVIPSKSTVSTYDMMRESDTVLSFGSTAGIEATFWGKPSILAGESFDRRLGATYVPESVDELLELLTRELEPKDREGELKYGYYLATFGVVYRYYQATGNLTGTACTSPLPGD